MYSTSSNALDVAANLGRAPRRVTRAVNGILPSLGRRVRDEWRTNENNVSHAYSKHYQRAIEVRQLAYLEVGVAPWSGKQSDMEFELGSRQSPPHLSGLHALDANTDWIAWRMRRVAEAAL